MHGVRTRSACRTPFWRLLSVVTCCKKRVRSCGRYHHARPISGPTRTPGLASGHLGNQGSLPLIEGSKPDGHFARPAGFSGGVVRILTPKRRGWLWTRVPPVRSASTGPSRHAGNWTRLSLTRDCRPGTGHRVSKARAGARRIGRDLSGAAADLDVASRLESAARPLVPTAMAVPSSRGLCPGCS